MVEDGAARRIDVIVVGRRLAGRVSRRQQRQRSRPAESARAVDPVLERAEAPALASEGEAFEQRGARHEVVVASGKRASVLRARLGGWRDPGRGSAQSLAETGRDVQRSRRIQLAESHGGGQIVQRRVCSRRTSTVGPGGRGDTLAALSRTLEASKGEAVYGARDQRDCAASDSCSFLVSVERRMMSGGQLPDVFALREQLVGDYRRYAESFLAIRDERIAEHVQAKLDEGLLWPDPPLQLNPSFEPGGLIDELIDDGTLHDECRRIFRAAKSDSDPVGRAILLHKHQADAIRAASTGANYVLTTGTGSGKSLAYIVPIVDYVLRDGPGDGRIKAIVVYPMNALANSPGERAGEVPEARLPPGQAAGDLPPVHRPGVRGAARRDPQQPAGHPAHELRDARIPAHPARRRRGHSGCQGPAVPCARRAAHVSGPPGCRRRSARAARARALPGQESSLRRDVGHDGGPGHVRRAAGRGRARGQPLVRRPRSSRTTSSARRCARRRSTLISMTAAFRAALAERVRSGAPPASYDEMVADPLASWIERTLGITWDADGRALPALRPAATARRAAARPRSSATHTGVDLERCTEALQHALMRGSETLNDAGFPVFAFRLHQFFSGGNALAASLDAPPTRHISTSGQQYVPDPAATAS